MFVRRGAALGLKEGKVIPLDQIILPIHEKKQVQIKPEIDITLLSQSEKILYFGMK